MCECNKSHEEEGGLSRRDLLRAGIAGTTIIALGPLAKEGFSAPLLQAPSTNKILIIVNMLGGNDSLNMVVPIGLQSYSDRRPTIRITNGLAMTGGPFGTSAYTLHPSLPRLQQLWNEGSLGVVRAVGYPNANQSHFESEDIWSYGVRNGFSGLNTQPSGWIARYADRHAPTSMGAVAIGVGRRRDFSGASYNPLLVDNLSNFQFATDNSFAQNFGYRQILIRNILAGFEGSSNAQSAKAAIKQSHDVTGQIQTAVSSYTPAPGVTYPNNSLGRQLQDAARLINAGFETRIFYTGFGGFDTHAGQGAGTGSHANLMNTLNGAIGAFSDDMKGKGVWNNIVIAVISEFGRRNYENGSGGTDHGAAAHVLLVGGGVNGGLYGPDLMEGDLLSETLDYEVDFRTVYKEILAGHLGVANVNPIFPEALQKNVNLGLF